MHIKLHRNYTVSYDVTNNVVIVIVIFFDDTKIQTQSLSDASANTWTLDLEEKCILYEERCIGISGKVEQRIFKSKLEKKSVELPLLSDEQYNRTGRTVLYSSCSYIFFN